MASPRPLEELRSHVLDLAELAGWPNVQIAAPEAERPAPECPERQCWECSAGEENWRQRVSRTDLAGELERAEGHLLALLHRLG
jgi:hypothetical protein